MASVCWLGSMRSVHGIRRPVARKSVVAGGHFFMKDPPVFYNTILCRLLVLADIPHQKFLKQGSGVTLLVLTTDPAY